MQNKTVTYTYDIGGNIVSKKEYAYTTGTLGTVIDTKNYTYDTVWKDKLASYDGNVINYDKMGNPTNYVSKDLSENDVAGALEYDGRQLVKATNISENCEYIYNENGLMTKKLVYENCDIDSNGKLVFSDLQSTFTYYWNDSKLTGYTLVNSSDGSFFNVKVMYGADGEPSGYTITGDNDFEMGFFYTKNLQGDITGIYTLEGASCLLFSYDAYGTPTYTVGDSFIGAWLSLSLNPFYYRGYMYDINTGLYYLQSRFYNPIYGRFLNADETGILHLTQGQIYGANLYGYCYNNPVNFSDSSGHFGTPIQWAFAIVGGLVGLYLGHYVAKWFGYTSGWKYRAIRVGVVAGGAVLGWFSGKALLKVLTKYLLTNPSIVSQLPRVVLWFLGMGGSTGQIANQVFQRYSSHIFEAKHGLDSLISKLGKRGVFNKAFEIASSKITQAQNGSNQIYTTINGVKVTIRFWFKDGTFGSFNIIKGHVSRVIGKLLK